MIVIKHLKEALGSFRYKLPSDPELMLYDFYFLTAYGVKVSTNDVNADAAIKEASEIVVDALLKHMREAVKYSIACEIRHIFDSLKDYASLETFIKNNKQAENFIKTYHAELILKLNTKDSLNFLISRSNEAEKERGILRKEDDTTRKRSNIAILKAQRKTGMTEYQLATLFYNLFYELPWDPSYGGQAWAKIVEGYQRLLSASNYNSKVIAIDHAYDLQHNTDTVFNKLRMYYKSGYAWLKRALNWKFNVTDIVDFYNKVSPQLKSIVAYIAKNVYNKTIKSEDNQVIKSNKPHAKGDGVWSTGEFSNNWEDGLFQDGKFTGAVWFNGEWLNGIWKGGIWKDGTWHDGTWEKGIWNYGTWIDGIWEDGSWKGGIWKDGTWKAGTWSEGTWEKGTWQSGIFRDSNWKDGAFHSGTFIRSFFEKGTIVGSTFKESTFFNGTAKSVYFIRSEFVNGNCERSRFVESKFRNGVCNKCEFENSTWFNGYFDNGRFFKGIWNKGISRDSIFKESLWHNGTWTRGSFLDSVWENGIWNKGIFKESSWKDGVWKDGAWENSVIWNPKTRKYEKSSVNPKECEWSLSYKKA